MRLTLKKPHAFSSLRRLRLWKPKAFNSQVKLLRHGRRLSGLFWTLKVSLLGF